MKLLIFHPALAPYRTDIFNSVSDNFSLSLYLESNNLREQNLNQKSLKNKLKFKPQFLRKGWLIGGRFFSIDFFRVLFKLKPEIIITSEYGLGTFSTLIWRIFTFSNVHHYIMCDDNYHLLNDKGLVKTHIIKGVSKFITGVIVPSQEVAELYKQRINKRNRTLRLPIIHNEEVFCAEIRKSALEARDAMEKHNLDGKRVFLYVGRLAREKNVSALLKAFSIAKIPNSKLIIVGDGPERDSLQCAVSVLGISEEVLFTGKIEGLKLLSWYFLAGLFILPSMHEPFGAVVNEALLAGCTVLCSEKAGARTLINKSNGAVFDPECLDELVILLQKYKPTKIYYSDIKMRNSKMPIGFKEVAEELCKGIQNAKLNE